MVTSNHDIRSRNLYLYRSSKQAPCKTDATVSVTVSEQAAPVAGTTTDFSICEGTFVTEALLNANITGNDSGTWSPAITPTSGAGTYTYTVAATAPCTTDATVSVTVSEQAAPVAGSTTDFSICEGTFVTEALLNANITGNDSGTWSPAITPTSGAGTYTYTVAAIAPCTTDATVSVTVSEQAAPVIGKHYRF